jgi:competence protein ComEA
LESSTPPWRVFDGPAPGTPGTRANDAANEAAGGGLPIQPIALLGLLGAFALGIGAIVIAAAGMGGDRLVDGPGVADGTFASPGPDGATGALVVAVAGAVVSPGVYRLPPGSRVGDAVQAAGGYGPRVDVERVAAALNLAATLTDGAQIRVPSRDDAPASTSGGSGGGASGGDGGHGGGSGLTDLNAASESELESLPGIGPVTAAKIIAARTDAPFRTIDELRERGLVGEKTFDSLKALITVG